MAGIIALINDTRESLLVMGKTGRNPKVTTALPVEERS
jgi:hypothetical protein